MLNCFSRSLLALLLGAGMPGGFSASVLAGDKIEFSSLDSENLAAPSADRTESEPSSIFPSSLFHDQSSLPQNIYPLMPPVTESPALRVGGLNTRNGNDGLGSDLERPLLNDGLGNSIWEANATNNFFQPASNYLGGLDAWGRPQNPDDIGRSLGDSRYDRDNARLESTTLLERRARPNGLDAGNAGSRSWESRKDDSSSGKTSVADMMKQQNKSLSEAGYDLLNPLSLFSSSKASSAWGPPSILPSDPAMISPLDASERDYNSYNTPAVRAPDLPSVKTGSQNQANSRGVPAMSAWGDEPAAGFQAYDPAAPRKPLVSPAQTEALRPRGGATLPRPKQPGSVFD